MLPQLPRLVFAQLSRPDTGAATQAQLERLRKTLETSNRLTGAAVILLALALGLALWALTRV
jgi:ubiquinone biosynthesis protein